jgi:hypothetical protein
LFSECCMDNVEMVSVKSRGRKMADIVSTAQG